MKREIDCAVFLEGLDALVRDELSDDQAVRFRAHAESCHDCRMVLKLAEHVSLPSIADLEAAVPAELVDEMWPRVRAEIGAGGSNRQRGHGPARRWYVRVSGIAAAAAILLVLGATAYLLQDVRGLRKRETVLVQQIADQQRWMAELELRVSGDPNARTAGLAGRYAWERLLVRGRQVSVADVESWLRSAPATATVLSTEDVAQLMTAHPYLRATLAEAATRGIGYEDGLQAGEALQLLEASDFDSGRRLSLSRLLGLLRSGPSRERL